MGAILLGIVVLVLILFVLRGFVSADPKALAKALRQGGAVAIGLFALVFLFTGRFVAAFFVAFLAWILFRGGIIRPRRWNPFRSNQEANPPETPKLARSIGMARAEALAVLGLDDGATATDIQAAHQRLMQQCDPHQMGSDYFAAKITQARDVLLTPRSV